MSVDLYISSGHISDLMTLKRDEPPQKMSKLAIAAEREEDLYDTQTRVKCYQCNVAEVAMEESNQKVVNSSSTKTYKYSSLSLARGGSGRGNEGLDFCETGRDKGMGAGVHNL